jgi:hypothetical protein
MQIIVQVSHHKSSYMSREVTLFVTSPLFYDNVYQNVMFISFRDKEPFVTLHRNRDRGRKCHRRNRHDRNRVGLHQSREGEGALLGESVEAVYSYASWDESSSSYMVWRLDVRVVGLLIVCCRMSFFFGRASGLKGLRGSI